MSTQAIASSNTAASAISKPAAEYNVAFGYLRAFLTVLVLAHHALLAYIPFAVPSTSFVAGSRWWKAFPIVDSQRWDGFGLLVGFNDTFFMSLMFLLSGLFVWRSLQHKGVRSFLRDRFLRLGLPFLGAAAIIAPLAYYPAYLTTTAHPTLPDFFHQWLALGEWPAGPVWFIWVLLAFDCAVAALFTFAPRFLDFSRRLFAAAMRRPITFYIAVVGVSAAAYLPMEFIFNALNWSNFGPFYFQTSRILHYFVYFLIGVVAGGIGVERTALSQESKLAQQWYLWSIACLAAFAVSTAIFLAAVTAQVSQQRWETAGDVAFVIACAASSFALLAVFTRFARTRTRLWDSLSHNAYGMYLVHYAFASWLQYLLLKAALPGIAKGSVAFFGTLLLSWTIVAAVRKVPAVGKII